MDKKHILIPGLILTQLFPAFICASKPQRQKKNVIFIAVDDLKPLLSCYGDPLAITPNMDRLASRGTLFTRAYCQQAVSGPTRASLLTGMRPDKTKVWDLTTKIRDKNPDVITLPQHFRINGYETIGIGKIYHNGQTDQMEDEPSWSIPYLDYKDCYDPVYGAPTGGRDLYQSPEIRKTIKTKGMSYVRQNMFYSTECVDVSDRAYRDGAIAEKAVKTIRAYKGDKPLFFAIGFSKPHLPFIAPQKYWDLYKREDMPLAQFRRRTEGAPEYAYNSKSGELRQYSDIPPVAGYSETENTTLPDDKAQELIHGYYACVSYVDAQLGKVLDVLEEKGMMKNTVIVFWGDHGWHLGDHGMWNKHTNFEEATHSTLMIIDPAIKPSVVSGCTEFVDIYPTLCELTGVAQPAGLDGKSLVKAMKHPHTFKKSIAVSQYPRDLANYRKVMGYSFRDKRYRYTVWCDWTKQKLDVNKVLSVELYDYDRDPLETRNLINEHAYQRIAAKMNKYWEIYQSENISQKK